MRLIGNSRVLRLPGERGFCLLRQSSAQPFESRRKFDRTRLRAGCSAARRERSTATPFSIDGVRPVSTSGQKRAAEIAAKLDGFPLP